MYTFGFCTITSLITASKTRAAALCGLVAGYGPDDDYLGTLVSLISFKSTGNEKKKKFPPKFKSFASGTSVDDNAIDQVVIVRMAALYEDKSQALNRGNRSLNALVIAWTSTSPLDSTVFVFVFVFVRYAMRCKRTPDVIHILKSLNEVAIRQ
ncbi:hypothetical protein HRR83_006822 [Exophiala dermatitidis]|uniref:Uncharacterized protein n=1 Tax=Exophiala dermatitidis TaxID=5970 RepID=A0AAN6ETW1_EXODE|nr:hypothetical protein HRR73_005861 [Exophiala dermatitidis]KAJ4512816.1 hypothetical protein HRR74_006514 [Exophiala dermatitidis]KAJ4542627.1 hypothetical protein HRR77_005820 [Exophiala dermatitidis]KAJ4548315.1 hypothetical protein HRR76_000919 [Exophiala dermatitidis]KAJ4570152.1 hypothetical protein HRR82_007364 [Exophiala dermatitidis]